MAFSFRIGTNWCHDFPKLAKESGFYFNMHRSRIRIDWNRISNIDIDRIIREKDFHSIDDNINSVIDYCLESEYDVKILDPSFVKLFRLAQLAVEYLLYCKQYLDHSVVILKDELKLKIEENVKLKKEITTLEEVVKHLKERAKERSKVVETKIGDCNGEIYKCPHCPKTFMSPMFVNAHIIRRHAYGSDLYVPASPMREHYRSETERLHNEIKNLKERLNETERVIRNETEKAVERKTFDYDRRQAENEVENCKRDNSTKSEEPFEHKGYQEEIKNLKSMLFDEIHNLRQKERTIHECTSETNVQTLINQQEKEFQKLRNQLLEKLTPDIEDMQVKLQAQENYWKSKMEHLENQHYKDVEKLATELKITRKTADDMKVRYESKVSDLEQQTTNQSSILIEQSKQLHSLSQELNISHLNGQDKDPATNLSKKYTGPIISDKSNEMMKSFDENIVKQNDSMNPKTQQIIVATNTANIASNSTSLNKILASESNCSENIHISKSRNKSIVLEDEHDIKQKSKKSEKIRKIESIKSVKKGTKHYSSSDVSESEDLTPEKDNNSKIRHIKFDQRITKTDLNKSGINKQENTFNKNIFNEFLSNTKTVKQSETVKQVEENLSSASNSESSISDSSSESVTTIHNNSLLHERKSHFPVSLKSKENTEHTSFNKIKSNLMDAFEQKLRDLGIDPEWQGIPKATFKQKMDIVKHHQKLAAKKVSKYQQIKLKIIEKLLAKISRKENRIEISKPVKRSPSRKVITNAKSRAMKVFIDQRNPGHHVSMLQNITQNKSHPQPETNCSVKNVIEYESPIKVTKPTSYNTIERLLKLSPNLTNNSENTCHTINSEESAITRDSLNKMKPLYKGLFNNKSNGNDSIDNSNIQEDLQNTSTSPKHNRSVLKSANASTTSLIKKKVIFDLTDERDRESSSDDDLEKEELSVRNWNSASTFRRETSASEPEEYKGSNSIVLKTAQSDKIAEISKKLEAQLSMVRQKPVGSIETFFSSRYVHNQENRCKNEEGINSGNMSSLLEGSTPSSTLISKNATDLLPQPAPRNLKDNMFKTSHTESISEISDLDSDIDKILKLE